ncbi:MAG: hypothetical protein ACM3U1_09770 [Chloroflexota bacterium]
MRKILPIAAAIFIAFFILPGCTDETIPTNPGNKDHEQLDPIVGKWEWIQTTGGIAGVYLTPQNTNETRIMTLSGAGEYTSIINGVADGKTKYYEIKREMSWLLNSMADYIVFYDKKPPATPINYVKTIYQYSPRKDTLYLIEEAADGFNYAFRRIR